jgi:hypothetical protein
MDHVAEVVLGYSRSKDEYHVQEIRGSWPTASYQWSTGVPNQGDSAAVVQVETIRIRVGDWLSESEATNLGARTHLIVRPYRAEGE